MCGVVALVRCRVAGADLLCGTRAGGIDAQALFGGVTLRREARGRDFHERRIAEKRGAVRIGGLHRLDHQVQGRGGLRPGLAQREAFEDVEHLDQTTPPEEGGGIEATS